MSIFRNKHGIDPPRIRSITISIPYTPNATVILDGSTPTSLSFRLVGITGADGSILFNNFPSDTPITNIHIRKSGYEDWDEVIGVNNINVVVIGKWPGPIPNDWEEILPGLVKISPKLIPLTINNTVFQLSNGNPFTIIECTDFRLFKRFLDGESIKSQLQQRQDIGFNTVRIFGMCRNLFDLNPINYPNYYEKIQKLALALTEYELRGEFVVFPDCALVMPNNDDQLRHWTRVCEALKLNLEVWLVELQNEADQAPNHIASSLFSQPGGLISSHGSNGSEAAPIEPSWSYKTFHTNSAFEWQRKVGHNAMELGGCVLSNENTRFPDNDSSSIHAFDAAAGAALLCAGSCYHGVDLRQSLIISGLELSCALSWVDGARSIDLSQRHEPYVHRIDLEGPNDLRVYQRGSAIVRIRY